MGKKLLVINPDQCMEVQFEQQITIGRDNYNSLSLQDPEISRSHAIIFEQESDTIIKDLRSRNGIYLRGEKVAEGLLHAGDEIILGSTVLIFDPTDTLDLHSALSKRGRYLIEKRSVQIKPNAPETTFTIEEMNKAIQSLFASPDSTTFFTMTNAMMLLQAIMEMDEAANVTQLFETALRHALTSLGGHHGVIMECDDTKEHLKVRSIISVENADTILIGQPILRALLGSEKCVFCSNIKHDRRFEQMAAKCKRPIHSFVAVPIKNQEELFGFIYLDSESETVSYDFATLRSLYFIAFHLGALLRSRPKHFHKHAAAAQSLHAAP